MNIPVKISGVRNIVSSPQIRALDMYKPAAISLMASQAFMAGHRTLYLNGIFLLNRELFDSSSGVDLTI